MSPLEPSPGNFQPVGATIEVDWACLAQNLPACRSPAGVEAREKIFKDLLVRADYSKEPIGSKVGSHKFKGTLSKNEAKRSLRATLIGHGAVHVGGHGEALVQVIEEAFVTARRIVEPVTVIEEIYLDMNGFHAFVIFLTHALDLRAHYLRCAPHMVQVPLAGWTLSQEEFKQFVRLFADSSVGSLYDSSWTTVEELQAWAADPVAAFGSLVQAGSASLSFAKIADMCLLPIALEAVDHAGGMADTSATCRKRAFQLLQALNNTPSLPNSVPGPVKPRPARGGSGESLEARGTDLMEVALASRWMTSTQRHFPPQTPRTAELACAPVTAYSNFRDRGVRPTSTCGGGGAGHAALRLTGGMIASPRVV